MRPFVLRPAFTLLEVLLALALTVLITGLIGGLLRIYITQVESGDEQVRQALLAEKILNMIGDDIRSAARYQPFDTAPLEEILSSSAAGGMSSAMGGGGGGGGQGGGGQGGGGQGGGGAPGGGITSSGGAVSSGGGSPSSSSSGPPSSSTSTGDTGGVVEAGDATQQGPLPPGVYGDEMNLQVDVSRLPRPDQYLGEQSSLATGRIGDIASDTKTVTYFVQSSSTMGVQDPLANPDAMRSSGSGGGLVRRQLDRSLTNWAQQQGQLDSLNRSGELIATEVVGIEFSYYDGTQWLTTWDSSQQGLPWLVQVQIALQSPRVAATNPIVPGIMLSSLDASTMSQYGIKVYDLMVPIPGVQLLNAAQSGTTSSSSGGDSGASALGLGP